MNYNIQTNVFGDKFYYLDYLLHRLDGPAVEFSNGNKYWYKHGNLHREDGPAKEYANGDKCWYLYHICYGKNNDFSTSSWISFVKTLIFS